MAAPNPVTECSFEPAPVIDDSLEDTPESLEPSNERSSRYVWFDQSTRVESGSPPFIRDIREASLEDTSLGESENEILFPSPPVEHEADSQSEPEADAAVKDRITLLARRYVSAHLSTEGEARLAILTERVRRLVPRVTAEDIDAVNAALDRLEAIDSRDRDRRERLGLESK